jgi:hypothetical protein
MIGEQLQCRFGIPSLEVVVADGTNGEPDGARELSILAAALDLVNPVRPNRPALNKHGVLHGMPCPFLKKRKLEQTTTNLFTLSKMG